MGLKKLSALFPVLMLALAIIFSFAIPYGKYVTNYASSLVMWLIFFNIGIQGLWDWLMHVLSVYKGGEGGYEQNPFHFKDAWCTLGLGASGFVALWFGGQYWLAIVIMATGFLLGSGLRTLKSMANHSSLHHLTSLIGDVVVPIALWVVIIIHMSIIA
jgi:hypothetical protein